jgi:rfaE bifunctional protein kinase chain/domain
MFPEEEIKRIYKKIEHLKLLIIGDVMIDAYLWGHVDRISPEAPVPIVAVKKRANRLGGAANVALNVKAMGATPILCSVIGQDEKADTFIQLMREMQMPGGGILKSKNRLTTTKFRVIGNNTQMLRVDEEIDNPLNDDDLRTFLHLIEGIFEKYQINGVIFQDYDKGVITPALIEKVNTMAVKRNIPVAVDPKKRNFSHYKNLKLFKPNLKELREGMGVDFEKHDMENLRKAIRLLHQRQDIEIVLTTLSEEGVFISRKIDDSHWEEAKLPAHVRSIADVSGAGDTVVSLASLCLALDLPIKTIAAISNLAGGQVCESVGVVPVDRDKLFKELSGFEQ